MHGRLSLPLFSFVILAACGDSTATSDPLPVEPADSRPSASNGREDEARTDSGTLSATLDPDAAAPEPRRCVLDTRTVYIEGTRKIESITAYGQYFSRTLAEDGSAVDAEGFPTPVATTEKFAPLCSGNPSCALDSRVVYFDGATKVETITAYGRYHVLSHATSPPTPVGGYPIALASVPAFASGPCAGHEGDCRFDTRALYFEGSSKIEVITAYGRQWQYRVGADGSRSPTGANGAPLEADARLAAGPCAGAPALGCALDTRTIYVDFDGRRAEEITARGRLWSFRIEPNTGAVETVADGRPLVEIPGLAAPCAPAQ